MFPEANIILMLEVWLLWLVVVIINKQSVFLSELAAPTLVDMFFYSYCVSQDYTDKQKETGLVP